MKLNSSEILAVCEVTTAELAHLLCMTEQAITEGRYGAARYQIEKAKGHTSNLRETVKNGLKAEEETVTCAT